MASNVLQKGQTYSDPLLHYRIDDQGIAYDLTTGQSLSKEEVDARIARAEAVDPATDDYAAREAQRGGVAGVFDRNKAYIKPVAELGAGALGFLAGGPAGAAAAGSAAGAAFGGLDRPGQGGIGIDPSGALSGGLQGAALGSLGGQGAKMLGAGSSLTAPKVPNIGVDANGMPIADPNWAGAGGTGLAALSGANGQGGIAGAIKNLFPGGAGGEGNLTAADWLKALGGGVTAGLDYKNSQAALDQRKNEFNRTTGNQEAQTAVNAQQLLNRAPMADNAQALLKARMGSAPTTFAPRDYTRTGVTPAAMQAPAQGGAQDQLAAARTAAAGYTPGAGGVDTSALELLKKRMYANSGMQG